MALTYKVYLDDNFIKEVENLNTVVDGLTKDTEYTIQVSETDGELESPLSEAVKFVTTSIHVQNVVLNETNKTLLFSESLQLTAAIQPDNATFKEINWSTSEPSIATVSETGLVETVGVGTVIITAESVDRVKGICQLTVNPAIIIPTTDKVVSVFGSVDPIGVELGGFDTGETFGGTEPVEVTVLNTKILEDNTLLEIQSGWIPGNALAKKNKDNKFTAIYENKSIEITTDDSFTLKFPINRYKTYVGQDGAKVGNEYWLFSGSSPDHVSTDYIHRIDPTDFSEIGSIKHNLGHANGVDYRDNTLLVYNGGAFPPEINLYKNPDNTKLELDIQDSANTQIIFKESNKLLPGDGSACFGDDKKIVYYAYPTIGKVVILKILLGLGNNDLSDKTTDKSDNKHWGSFVSGKSSDDYNGTAQIIASYTGNTSGDNQPQGMAFNGDLYVGISIQDPKAYQLQLLDNGRFKVVDIYKAEMTDSGNNVIPLEPEITLIDPTRQRLFIGSRGGNNNSLSNLAEFTL